MSIGEDYSNYYADAEAPETPEVPVPQFDPSKYVPVEQFQTQQKQYDERLNQITTGLQTALGVNQKSAYDPQEEYARTYIGEKLGYISRDEVNKQFQEMKQEMIAQQASSIAVQEGFPNLEVAINHFNYNKAIAQATNDKAKLDELNKIEYYYNNGDVHSAFKIMKNIAPFQNAPVPNMSIGNSPSTNVQSGQGSTQYRSRLDFNTALSKMSPNERLAYMGEVNRNFQENGILPYPQ